MQTILENIGNVDELKGLKIGVEDDEDSLQRNIYVYLERKDNPCFGKNGRK